ncbi:MAG TPA: DNA gyrase C-terminal beta-propeller domain-containing protein, partial [Gemmata sp.]|nr:DNA gyrase C-terminal beta-propeller domain-containing protein [Gemmata sp.]
EDDFVEHFFVASTKAYLLCFTNKGQMYWLKVHRIPTASRTSAGRSIANVLSLKPEEKITSIVPVREFTPEWNLMMATRNGTVKKTELMAYSNVRAGGIIGITIDEGDELIGVCLTRLEDEVVLATRNGMAIRFSEADARAMGRTARGVRGIKLGKDDEVVGMVVADPEGHLLSVTENGYGKRTPFGANTDPSLLASQDEGSETESEAEQPSDTVSEDSELETDPSGMRYRIQRRGGKGLKDVKVTAKNGRVVGIASARPGDEIMVITQQGMVTRSRVDDIRIVGRNTQGVKVMTPAEGDKIVTIAKVASENIVEPPAESPA